MRRSDLAACILMLAATCCSVPAAFAEEAVVPAAANAFLQDFYTALRHHDGTKLNAMIDDKAQVVVLLVDEAPPMQFTLGKADFLQQIKSVWHFATREQYQISNLSWRADKSGNGVWAVFDESESRVVLDAATGQRNRMEVLLVPAGQGLQIAGIHARTSLW